MKSISMEDYLTIYKNENGTITKEFIERLKQTVDAKSNGAVCDVCEDTIWAIGSAVSDRYLCFQCVTGEEDSSKDLEIDKVNFKSTVYPTKEEKLIDATLKRNPSVDNYKV